MSTPAPPRIAWKDLIGVGCALLSVALVLAGSLRADGGRTQQIEDHARRIVALEAADRAQTELLTKIDGRTIRIETRLEHIGPRERDRERDRQREDER